MPDAGDQMEEAIHEWVAAQLPGGVVTGYVVFASALAFEDMDKFTHYFTSFPDDQPMHVSVGLAKMLDRQVEAIGYADDDEESE